MINFLVKLANFLDENNNCIVAKELDDLILKLAQEVQLPERALQGEVINPEYLSWPAFWFYNLQEFSKQLTLLKEVVGVNAKDLNNISNSAIQAIDFINNGISELSQENTNAQSLDFSLSIYNYLNNKVFEPIDTVINSKGIPNEHFQEQYKNFKSTLLSLFKNISNAAQHIKQQNTQAIQEKRPEVAPKQQQSAKTTIHHYENPETTQLIKNIQGVLGVDTDGVWGPDTNKAFIKYMNANYPIAMKNNVFVGPVIDNAGHRGGNTLDDAWQLIQDKQKSLQEQQQEDMSRTNAPAAQNLPNKWHSKYFQITPEIKQLLNNFEKENGDGSGQQLVNIIDRIPNLSQQDFEENIKSMV